MYMYVYIALSRIIESSRNDREIPVSEINSQFVHQITYQHTQPKEETIKETQPIEASEIYSQTHRQHVQQYM
jgi:hypothetical protein